MFSFNPAAFGSHFRDCDGGGIVKKQFGVLKFLQLAMQKFPFTFIQLATAPFALVNPGKTAQGTLRQLSAGHFQTENNGADTLHQCGVGGNIHGHRCFAAAGTRRQNNQIALLQAGKIFV